MHIKFSSFVIKELSNIKRKDKKLSDRIQKQLLLFTSNPKHPSLRTHKLAGSMNNMWSISISMHLRMVYKLLDNDHAYFIDLGTHNEVYGK